VQRDCQDLRRQLARCTPSEFDRLHSELVAAQRAAAGAPVLQEQLERQRAAWQAAEERLAKLQARVGPVLALGRRRAAGVS
jgi:hypothetical protein